MDIATLVLILQTEINLGKVFVAISVNIFSPKTPRTKFPLKKQHHSVWFFFFLCLNNNSLKAQGLCNPKDWKYFKKLRSQLGLVAWTCTGNTWGTDVSDCESELSLTA